MLKFCPSAQPGMNNCRVLGIVNQDGPAAAIVYLNQILPATADILALAAPFKPTEVFRLAATCAEEKCPHFDGADCRLATRIVQMLPAVVDALPPCTIRKDCRWFTQEGLRGLQALPGGHHNHLRRLRLGPATIRPARNGRSIGTRIRLVVRPQRKRHAPAHLSKLTKPIGPARYTKQTPEIPSARDDPWYKYDAACAAYL